MCRRICEYISLELFYFKTELCEMMHHRVKCHTERLLCYHQANATVRTTVPHQNMLISTVSSVLLILVQANLD